MSTDKQPDKQRLLDLLVDGELSESQRSELLAWCEREPDGWRRCALAFLEAQNWSSVLGALADAPRQAAAAEKTAEQTARNTEAAKTAEAKTPKAKTAARPASFWNARQWGTMLAMAASVVLAFTLGLWVRDAGKAGQISPAGPPALNVVSSGQPSGGQGGRTPVVDRGDMPGGDWFPVEAGAVPDDVRQALERLGHHVEQQRRLVPYRLDDGRRVVIPVDRVKVRPVEIRSFQ